MKELRAGWLPACLWAARLPRTVLGSRHSGRATLASRSTGAHRNGGQKNPIGPSQDVLCSCHCITWVWFHCAKSRVGKWVGFEI